MIGLIALASCSPGGLTRAQALKQLRALIVVTYGINVFEVTGIADTNIGQGFKEVQFKAAEKEDEIYKNCTPVQLSAIFRKYDDGWRIETIDGVGILRTETIKSLGIARVWLFNLHDKTRAACKGGTVDGH
jgi:hypothetical protein